MFTKMMNFPAGVDPAKVEQSALDEATAWKMKVALIGFQVVGLFFAIAIMWFYPITPEKAPEIKRRLWAEAA